jgi:formamidopyrimidine-DNA glycosylase
MPEGPEVKLSADVIRPLIVGHICLDAIPSSTGRYRTDPPDGLECFNKSICKTATRITEVKTKGKFMYWAFAYGWYMFNTYGMTGQWSEEKGKHPCVEFLLLERSGNQSRSHSLFFNDPRHFGTIRFTNSQKELTDKLDELGWDPLAEPFSDYKRFITNELRSSKTMAELLMDQGIFAGVGNYIKSESLYRAKISPLRRGNSLNNQDIDLLCQSIVDVMQESYQQNGATIQTYQTVHGERGEYSDCFKVYGKKADPLGNPVRRQTTADKRSTYWCPAVQT